MANLEARSGRWRPLQDASHDSSIQIMTKKSIAVLDSNAENLEKRNLLFTVSTGRKANLLAEGAAEISRIVKTHLVSDVCDAGTGVTQQHFSFLDAIAIQI